MSPGATVDSLTFVTICIQRFSFEFEKLVRYVFAFVSSASATKKNGNTLEAFSRGGSGKFRK